MKAALKASNTFTLFIIFLLHLNYVNLHKRHFNNWRQDPLPLQEPIDWAQFKLTAWMAQYKSLRFQRFIDKILINTRMQIKET